MSFEMNVCDSAASSHLLDEDGDVVAQQAQQVGVACGEASVSRVAFLIDGLDAADCEAAANMDAWATAAAWEGVGATHNASP